MEISRGKLRWLLIPAVLWLILAAGTSALAQTDGEDNQDSDEETVDLRPVMVQDVKAKNGSSEVGYLMGEATQLGPWGELPLQDTPYSMSVISGDFIKNLGLGNNVDQLMKYVPAVYDSFYPSESIAALGPGRSMFFMRGFEAPTLVEGFKINGDYHSLTLDDMDRVEVIPGFNSFMYGAGHVGGAVNFVLKRPTAAPYYSVTLGNAGGEQYYIKTDLGGPLAGGKFGYRLNAWYYDGEGPQHGLSYRRKGLALALDWHVLDDLLLSFDFSQKQYIQKGNLIAVRAPDNEYMYPVPSNKESYGQDWTGGGSEETRYGFDLNWDIGQHLTVRGSYKWSRETVWRTFYSGGIGWPGPWADPNTQYDVYAGRTHKRAPIYNKSGSLYADFKYDTFGIDHKTTVGYNSSVRTYWVNFPGPVGSFPTTQSSWSHPKVPAPDWSMDPCLYWGFGFPCAADPRETKNWKMSRSAVTNLVIGDQMDFGRHWTLMAGMNYARLDSQSFRIPYVVNGVDLGLLSADNRQVQSSWTPTVSLLYKPTDWLTVYGTYIQAIEPGRVVSDRAGDYRLRNAGELIPMTKQAQYELGTKVTLNDSLLLSLALFFIDKANDYITYDDATMTAVDERDGRQVHKGVELTVTGKATDRLTLLGGVTWLDAKIKKANNRFTIDHTPSNTPEWTAKLYAEYELPMTEGLFVTGGFSYVGPRHYDVEYGNIIYGGAHAGEAKKDRLMGGHTLYELGARLETNIKGINTIFRLNVENLFDKAYYLQPYFAVVGKPRTIVFSTTFEF